jgi:hypothetical protein
MKDKYYITDETMEFSGALFIKLRNEFNWRSKANNGQVVYAASVTRNKETFEPEITVSLRRSMTEEEDALFQKEVREKSPVPVRVYIVPGPATFA